MRCIDKQGKRCPHLSFNVKGNYLYHCHFNKLVMVQVPEIDLERNIPCPLDVGTNPKEIYKGDKE